MKLYRAIGLILATQLLVVATALGQGGYKVEAIGAAPADVPAAVQNLLDSQGARVANDQGAPL